MKISTWQKFVPVVFGFPKKYIMRDTWLGTEHEVFVSGPGVSFDKHLVHRDDIPAWMEFKEV